MGDRIEIGPLRHDELDEVVALFGAYLEFYEQPADGTRIRTYLARHLAEGTATVLVARGPDGLVGFALLYPTWDSLELAPRWILHDLFVAPVHRRAGTGRALVEAGLRAARESAAAGVSLDTARDNLAAQALYESLGFERDDVFVTYHHPLGPSADAEPSTGRPSA